MTPDLASSDTTGGQLRLGSRRLLQSMVATALLSVSLVLAAPASPARADATFNQQLLTLMNQSRAANGLAPLLSYAPIGSVAESGNYGGCGYNVAGRATDMGTRNYFSHTILNCGTQNVFRMLTAAGIQWSSAAENIGWESGSPDPLTAARRLHDQFMNSPGHRANILEPASTHVGVGSWHTAPGQTWSGGGAPYSNVTLTAVVFARVSVPVAQVPGAVPNVVATASDGRATVTWRPAAANGAGVDIYGVWAFTTAGYSGHSAAACGSCTTAVVDGLSNGTEYVFVALAHNSAGWGEAGYSNLVSPGIPSAPPWVSATAGPGQVRSSWGAATPAGSPVDMYMVLAYEGATYSGQAIVTCGTCTSGTVTGLTRGRGYNTYVLAHSVHGWSPATPSPTVTVT